MDGLYHTLKTVMQLSNQYSTRPKCVNGDTNRRYGNNDVIFFYEITKIANGQRIFGFMDSLCHTLNTIKAFWLCGIIIAELHDGVQCEAQTVYDPENSLSMLFFVISFKNDVIVTTTTVCVTINALGPYRTMIAELHNGV